MIMFEELLLRFREQWEHHLANPGGEPRPQLHDYLPSERETAEKVFWVLANDDLHYRLEHLWTTETPRVEDYLAMPLASGITEDCLIELIRTELTERLLHEPHLTPDEYVHRFP